MSDNALNFPVPVRGGDIPIDPKYPGAVHFDITANERIEITARGRWSTHPHGDPNFTGPSGDHANLLGSWPEGCMIVSAYRGRFPLESIPFLQDDEKISFKGPAKILIGVADDPKGFDDNFSDPANPMTITFKIYDV